MQNGSLYNTANFMGNQDNDPTKRGIQINLQSSNNTNIMTSNKRQILDLNEKISNLNLEINTEKASQKINYE